MTLRAPLALALTALLAAAHGSAQTSVIDEGSFRISVRGSIIGTETFTIRRSGSDANVTTIAQGRVILSTGEETRTVIQLRGDMLRPTAYQIETAGDQRQSITGRAAGNRFRATTVSAAGEQMREYLVDDDGVVLHDGIAHHHYFIANAGAGSVPVIVPQQNRQLTATVEEHGPETIQVAGQQVEARRFSVEIPGLDTRSVWVDDRNRVLRIRIPDQGLSVERSALP